MNRRHFLRTLGLAAAGVAAEAVLDPERLLWVPGAKKIFLPPAPVIHPGWMTGVDWGVELGDVLTIVGVYTPHPLTDRDTGQLQQFVVSEVVRSGGEIEFKLWPKVALPPKPQVRPVHTGKYVPTTFTWNEK